MDAIQADDRHDLLLRENAKAGDSTECQPIDEPSADSLQRLRKAIRKQPIHRKIYYRVLEHCSDESGRVGSELEQFIMGLPEFEYAIQPSGRFIEVLEREHGIVREDFGSNTNEADQADGADEEGVDEEGLVEGGDPDELDDAEEAEDSKTPSYLDAIWHTTDEGLRVLDEVDPSRCIDDAVTADPERTPFYLAILRACSQQPRTLSDIAALVSDGVDRSSPAAHIQPSIYLDKLERAGGLYWKRGWITTEEGRGYIGQITDNTDK